MKRQLTFLVAVTLIALSILIGLLGYWNFYPYNPINTSPNPYPIVYPVNKIVTTGGFITYEFSYTKTSHVVPTIQRQFVDGLVFNVADPQTPTVTDIGTGVARVQVKIPETLPPGNYYLKIDAIYQMNPIKDYHHTSRTETFEVVAREEL